VLQSSFKSLAISVGFAPLKAWPMTSPRIYSEISNPLGRFPEIEPKGVRVGGILVDIVVGGRRRNA
jgi:hypothetical protein